jgi:cysteine-rich repeat protein
MRQGTAWVGVVALAAGCFQDSGLVLSASATTGGPGESSGELPTTGVPENCGDLQVQPGEQCDLGAENSDAGICTSKCQINVCGDGAKSSSEGCDDGNLDGGDGCSATCDAESCGDGQVQANEECDDGNDADDDRCTGLCRPPFCGDGFVQASAGEQCDAGAGNSNSGACLLSCAAARCGDGFVGPGEQCDDGGQQDGDGCSRECAGEGGLCGNGLIDVGEECDDGNGAATDECTNACKQAQCGDDIVRAGVEECDDGNTQDFDGCSSQCQVEGEGGCGDGVSGPAEECDDGNLQQGDGCSPTCTKEFRRVFVTSEIFTGALGGIMGAHNKCQTAANAAGLPGKFLAWLSTAESSPAQEFVKSAVPYIRVDGVVVAKDWDDLTDGSLTAPISLSETGLEPNAGMHGCALQDVPIVWTNTNEQGVGQRVYGDCGGWTGSDGDKGTSWGRPDRTDVHWTAGCGGGNCSFQASLYCFEQ